MSAVPELADLPRPLQPWKAWLGWFEPMLALQIGDMVRRLADIAGAAPASGRAGAPEPDGLGDLRSRGPYERLLASEWLLAEELPDEFLRRAAAAEHLFLAPLLRARRVERSVVAIFDAGPRALGAARLAHIAAWILLARRAADAGGTLRWGVLQAPGKLHPGDAVTQLNALMKARRFDAGPAGQAEAWRAALGADDDPAEREVWWIGAAPLPGQALRNERTLALQAAFDGSRLDAVLGSPAGLRRTSLPLPEPATATRLLRGEFMPPVFKRLAQALHKVGSSRLSLTRTLIMSMPPGHVAVPELEAPAMTVFAVPQPGQSKFARPRRQAWSSTRLPIAAALSRGETLALSSDASTLHFWQMPGFAPRERPGRHVFEASASTANWMAMIRLQSDTQQRACVIDRAGRLVSWAGAAQGRGRSRQPAPDLETTVIDADVPAMVQLAPDRMAYAHFFGNGLWLRTVGPDAKPSTLTRRLCRVESGAVDVFFTVRHYGGPRAAIGSMAIAPRHDAPTWKVLTATAPDLPIDQADGASSFEHTTAPGEKVLGLTNQRGTHPPALVVLSADRRRLRLVTATSWTTLHEANSIVERCVVCPVSGHVALLTRDRTLRVLDPAGHEPLLVVTGNDVPASDDAPEASHDDA